MKNICVVSSSRADYGLLYWPLKKINESKDLNLNLIVTGMHLSEKFGNTWKLIENDGFEIAKKVDLGSLEDSKSSIVSQISVGVNKFLKAYEELSADLVVVLGDRYEIFAAAQSAVFAGTPIAHIHGGEVTEGAFDDIIRNAITKMSTYHFTATDVYKKRVIQMGEQPENVLNTGAPGLENIRKLDYLSKSDLETSLGFKLRSKNFLITYHPVTAIAEDATENLIKALEDYKDFGQIITLPNSDPGHEPIIKKLEAYAKANENVFVTTSLGSHRYLSLMKLCDVVIGNSSSGIIEAPFLGTPTLNIGKRQQGRMQADSVINVDIDVKSIISGIEEALLKEKKSSDLYGDGYCAEKIVNFLEKTSFKVKRGFYDI